MHGYVDQSGKLKEVAQVAYEAYAKSTGWLNFLGARMPEWSALPDKIREAWRAASEAARAAPA